MNKKDPFNIKGSRAFYHWNFGIAAYICLYGWSEPRLMNSADWWPRGLRQSWFQWTPAMGLEGSATSCENNLAWVRYASIDFVLLFIYIILTTGADDASAKGKRMIGTYITRLSLCGQVQRIYLFYYSTSGIKCQGSLQANIPAVALEVLVRHVGARNFRHEKMPTSLRFWNYMVALLPIRCYNCGKNFISNSLADITASRMEW